MVFKRRERRSWLGIAVEVLYPRGGWARAFQYMHHRLRRIPDSPERIARGIFAGVYATFTPFYGLHFILAVLLARAMKGNVVAALIGTFFGNPLTYIPIIAISLKTGHFILGTELQREVDNSVLESFFGAARDLLENFLALFTPVEANWTHLAVFYHDVFFPALVGGIVPGIVSGLACYYLSLPVVRAYQKHRRARLKKKMDSLRSKTARKADEGV